MYCPKCGHKNEPGSQYCPQCGKPLPAPESPASSPDTTPAPFSDPPASSSQGKKGSPKNILLLALIFLVVLVGAGAGAFFLFTNRSLSASEYESALYAEFERTDQGLRLLGDSLSEIGSLPDEEPVPAEELTALKEEVAQAYEMVHAAHEATKELRPPEEAQSLNDKALRTFTALTEEIAVPVNERVEAASSSSPSSELKDTLTAVLEESELSLTRYGDMYLELADQLLYTDPVRPKEVFSLGALSADSNGAMFRANPARTGVYPGEGPRTLSGVAWEFETGGEVFTSPAVAGGTVYVGSNDNNLYALE